MKFHLTEGGTPLKKISIIGIISFAACILWMLGFEWTIFDYFYAPPSGVVEQPSVASAEENEDECHIVAFGDSLTRGTGDAEGKGYAGYVMDELKEKQPDLPLFLHNYGIKGLTSSKLREQVVQKEVQRQLQQANLVFISIGGNDLFQGGQTLARPDISKVDVVKEAFLTNLSEILTVIRSVNRDATVYLIGLYNPFSDFDDVQVSSQIIRDWNYASAELAANFAKIVFVPTFDIFQLNVNHYLYSDHFHPNTRGYQLIAERLSSLIELEKGERG
ncbi:SGNH/GDSL hydrolase family protein [Bacillaceae bacterium Marseille-Q3522]|nr:SGNH/GDSL hydrolase family protein [Bacillaceae bacterium Marseille-Q3522]